MTGSYDIVMRRDDFVLYRNDEPYKSQNGNLLVHKNARLLRYVITHEMNKPGEPFSPLEILKALVDEQEAEKSPYRHIDIATIEEDPTLSVAHKLVKWDLGEVLHQNPMILDFIFLNASSLASALNHFLLQKEEGQSNPEFIKQTIGNLTDSRAIILCFLNQHNAGGIVLHLLLILGYLSVSEYVAALLIGRIREQDQETIRQIETMEGLIALQRNLIEKTRAAIDFDILCRNQNHLSVVEEIIARGEDGQTEFKSTLRWDLRQMKKSPDIEHASLKTICAFLNSEGGDLLIGVRDDGSLEGIETDQFDNDDKFLLHLWMLIKTSIGHEISEWVKTSLQKFGTKTICRVNCKKAAKPVFLNHKGAETFYIRVGPASNSLEIRSALNYIGQHFS
jgi:hypothetical protein